MGQIEYAPKRPRPLPFLILNTDLQTGARLAGTAPSITTHAAALSKSTATALESLLHALPPTPATQVHPMILDPEKGIVTSGGAEYTLKKIVDGPFTAKDWAEAITALNGYLNIRRSAAVTSRARFYLGQAYYFAGNYRKSFLEFLFAENDLYTVAQPWINALFSKLTSEKPAPPE
jgi:TolA-binding protein